MAFFTRNAERKTEDNSGCRDSETRLEELERRVARLEKLLDTPDQDTVVAVNTATAMTDHEDACDLKPEPPHGEQAESAQAEKEPAEKSLPELELALRCAQEQLRKDQENIDMLDHELAKRNAEIDAKAAKLAELEWLLNSTQFELEQASARAQEAGYAALRAEQKKDAELAENEKRVFDFKARLAKLESELESVRRQKAELRGKLELWQGLGLQEEQGRELARIFAAIPESYRAAVSRYYNLDNCLVFACQCGVVARMRQCWEACRELALANKPVGEIPAFLSLLLELYNSAFPDNPCQLLSAWPGEVFDYEKQDRLGPQGRKVEHMILPGFIMPNGGIGVKCFVELD